MRCPTRALTLSAALLALFGPIVAAAAQDPPAIHNSRLIYSAEEKLGRDLDRLLEASAPHLLPQRETLSHWAAFAGISPRVVLTLMELRSGAVRGVLANPLRPLGDQVPESGFSDQLREGLGQLADHFYAYRHPGSADDPLAGYPDYRAAEAASEALLRWLGSAAEVERFHTTYAALFPTAGPLDQPAAGWSPPLKATVPPANLLQLPYAVGQTWIFNGTHTYGGNEVGPKSSIDIARNWPPWGANTANDWVVAANAGTAIVHSSCYVEVLGSGGWSTTYYHLDNVIVTTGQSVGRNQRLSNYANNTGQALCNGGHSTGPHLHFSLKRNGQATSLADVSLSGYIVHPGRHDYDSNCDFMWLERAGVRHCAWNPLTNPGVTAAAPAAPSNLTADSQSSSEIELRWTDNANNETSFEIQRGQGGSFQTVATVGANTTRHVDASVASGTLYTYRLRARNGTGASAWSGNASATTAGEPPPSDLTAVALSKSAIELEWLDTSGSESGFEIEARSNGSSFSLVASVPADTTSATVSGLSSQTEYTFRARTIGGQGDSTYSKEATATTFQADPEACVDGPETMCLNAGRFKVEVTWSDFVGSTGPATVVPMGSADSGLLWFFDAANWEMLIKVLDGCGLNDRFWVFAAATTDVEYTLRVTDSYTGFSRTYFNPLGNASAAVTDTDAFDTCQALPPPGLAPPNAVGTGREAKATTAPICDGQPDSLCLNDDRFEVDIEWEDFSGTVGSGKVVPFGSADSGLFWFFSAANWEVLVKVLDGCGINDHFWVFAAATTDVKYTLRVRDRQTGLVKEYTNPLGVASDAITDTSAFASCP